MSSRQLTSRGGQPGVLPLFANRQGKLAVGNDHNGGLFLGVQFHMNHFGGADGLGDEPLGVGFPRHYINLFPLEFVDDALDAVAAQADAGPHRVDALLGGVDSYLAAKAGVPGDGFDFHGAVIDFRHFNLKEAFQHIPVAAGRPGFPGLWPRSAHPAHRP